MHCHTGKRLPPLRQDGVRAQFFLIFLLTGTADHYHARMGSDPDMTVYSLVKLIAETRRLAAEYRRTTGQSLPVSGEIARHDAARILDLTLCEPRSGGVDALGKGKREGQRIQIKSRILTQDSKPGTRLGQLNTAGDWNTLLLVIMDEEYEPCEISEAARDDIMDEIAHYLKKIP